MINYPIITEIVDFTDYSDLYLCAIGFEDRSLASNKQLLQMNFKTKKSILLQYDEYKKENEEKKSELENVVRSFSDDFTILKYSLSDTAYNENSFRTMLSTFNLPLQSVTINISSFTTHALMFIVNSLIDIANNVRIIYTEPEGYSNQLNNSNAFSSGVKEIFTLSEFYGASLPGYLSLLVIFLGYDFIRARGIYQQIQPSKKIGIMATPNTPNLEQIFIDMQKEHKKSFSSTDEIRLYSIFNLKELLDGLENIRRDNIETCNISIALNGSKLHHVGALLFARKFKDVQLIISTPSEYFPKSYSYGSRRTFEFVISREFISEYENNN